MTLIVDTKKIEFELIKWLYVNDGGYNNKIAWRKAFLEKLNELLEE